MFDPGDNGLATEVVRYGRARLTIARSQPPLTFTDFDELLAAYARGEAEATSVAAAFLRERVVDHSASFDWRTAKLRGLIPIVCELSESPKLEASTPKELADALARAAGHTPGANGSGPAGQRTRKRLVRIPLPPLGRRRERTRPGAARAS